MAVLNYVFAVLGGAKSEETPRPAAEGAGAYCKLAIVWLHSVSIACVCTYWMHFSCIELSSVFRHCWLGDRKGIWPVNGLRIGILVMMIIKWSQCIWLHTFYSSGCHHCHFHHILRGMWIYSKLKFCNLWHNCYSKLMLIYNFHKTVFQRDSCLYSCVKVQCIVIGPVCGWVCGSFATITRNCMHQSSANWVCR